MQKISLYSILELKKFASDRKKLAAKFELINNTKFAPVITERELKELYAKIVGNIRVKVETNGDISRIFQSTFEAACTEKGVKVNKILKIKEIDQFKGDYFRPINYTVKMKIREKSLPFRVEGFIKHRYTNEVEVTNSKNEIVGKLNYTGEFIGREGSDFSKTLKDHFKNYIENNFNNLNIM